MYLYTPLLSIQVAGGRAPTAPTGAGAMCCCSYPVFVVAVLLLALLLALLRVHQLQQRLAHYERRRANPFGLPLEPGVDRSVASASSFDFYYYTR